MTRSITAILGNSQRLDGGAMFGNAPKALWTRWMAPDDRNRIPLACRAMLVEDRGRRILHEAGIGAFFEPRLRDRYGVVEPTHVLLASLADVGLIDADIDVVVLSHLHFDHVGGLLSAWVEGTEPTLLFPNATFLVGRAAWHRAKNLHPRDRASFIPGLCDQLEATGRLEWIDNITHPVTGDGWRFHTSDGHTPGLILTEVAMPCGPVLFAADLIPGRPWVHVPITMGYDRFPEQLIDEKRAVLNDLFAREGRLFFTHDHGCAMARITCDDRGRFSTLDEVPNPMRWSG